MDVWDTEPRIILLARASSKSAVRVRYEISVHALLFVVLIKVKTHRIVSAHDFLQGVNKNVLYNVSVIFWNGFKRGGKGKFGRTESLRNSQA
jgi:hypothetical protein